MCRQPSAYAPARGVDGPEICRPGNDQSWGIAPNGNNGTPDNGQLHLADIGADAELFARFPASAALLAIAFLPVAVRLGLQCSLPWSDPGRGEA